MWLALVESPLGYLWLADFHILISWPWGICQEEGWDFGLLIWAQALRGTPVTWPSCLMSLTASSGWWGPVYLLLLLFSWGLFAYSFSESLCVCCISANVRFAHLGGWDSSCGKSPKCGKGVQRCCGPQRLTGIYYPNKCQFLMHSPSLFLTGIFLWTPLPEESRFWRQACLGRLGSQFCHC